ncbi:MAG TPA: C-type lectin domain-containing protein [Kofleriaceae bacterium]|nr:C-type lectin domain-containing protein [Kofleriaceae bacterium]
MWRLAVVLALAGCDGAFGLLHVYPPEDAPAGGDTAPDAPRIRPDGEPANCPADYTTTLVTTASRYKLVTTTADWATAAAMCAANSTGAHTHLMVLSAPEEWEELRAQAGTMVMVDTWIGFSDRVTEGTFQWVTAEPNQYAQMYMMTPWEIDQPDGDGDCGEIRMASAALHDKDCANTDPYICECDDSANDPSRY